MFAGQTLTMPTSTAENISDEDQMPNLFVIGASKTGSSALHKYLRLHPEIFMSPVKEPCFFVDPTELREAWPIMARDPVSHQRTAYLELFRDGAPCFYRGEASVYYSQHPHRSAVPERIAAEAPDARILYIVREPISRTIAHYWQRAKEFQENLPLHEAILEHPIYRDTSDYALQLGQYLTVFPQQNIYVILSEDLRTDRVATMARLFDWLGLDTCDLAPEDLADIHVSSAQSRTQRFGFVRDIRNSATWQQMRQKLPRPAVDMLRELATKSFDKQETDDIETRRWLKSYFTPRVDRFEDMLGRSLDVWRHQWKEI